MELARSLIHLVILLALAAAARAEVVVVVNRDIDLERLDREELRDLMLGRRANLVGNLPVELVLPADEAVQGLFFRRYVNLTPSQFRIHWKRMVFTGQGRAPTVCDSDLQVVEYVRAHPQALAFIAAETPHDQLKVLAVTER